MADLIYTTKLDDPQKGLYELLEIEACDRRAIITHNPADSPSAKYAFDLILEGLDNFKM